eukprot:g565.t1
MGSIAQSQVAFEQNVVINDRFGALNPQGISTGDINGDGFDDLLIAGYGDVVWVPATDGIGNYDRSIRIIPDFVEANNIEAADFDADGDQDVVVFARADNGSYEVLYLENTDGSGAFADPFSLANTDALIRLNLQVLDIDNDGDIDIAYSSNDNISWLENTDGQASFTDHYLLGTNDGFYTIDFDGDQITDFVADFGYDLRAYKLNADGTLAFLETMNTFSLNNDHKAGDIDGDGDNDVVTFFENGNTRQVHWYENTDGLGTFGNRQVLFDLPTISGGSNSDRKGLEVVDMDGDELVDVVTFESRRNGMSWYKNLGAGLFDVQQIVSEEVPTISAIAVADVDNSGSPDILAVDFFQHEYAWFNNEDGLGAFGDKIRISSYAHFVNHVDYGDVDGDGDLDLVSSSHGDNKVAWYENTDGTGDFSELQHLVSTTTDGARDIFAVDLDGDEDLDLLVSSYLDATTDEYQLVWFENDGSGDYTTEHIFETTEETILRINCADVDDDGDMDVISGQDGSVLALYRNNGDGTFAVPETFSAPGFAYLLCLEIADIDNDGDPDVLASYNNDEIIWHENDGAGDLTTKHIITAQMGYPSSIYATDVDGDGDQDVLFTNQFVGEIGYFLNEDGAGTFGEAVVTSEVLERPSAIFSMDVDYDGDMDMIANSISGEKFVWFRNDGEANFEEAREITSLIGRVNHITAADINADGRTDLITSSYDDSQVAWFENLGTAFTNTILGVVRLDANGDGCDDSDATIPNLLIHGDELLTTVMITPTAGDTNEEDNSFELAQTVINSYDPNDIRVLEGEEVTIEEADNYLHYIIRFQNTGTASAINVRVNNVLDNELDWSTLQLESLSHPGRVEIMDGNLVDFIFDGINLPDSTSNEPASHGFIAYKIKPRSNVAVGDIFTNVADIYFDFNPAIVTNTVNTEIVLPVSVDGPAAQLIRVFPNPAATTLTIEAGEEIHSVRVYDVNGRLLQSLKPASEMTRLDVSFFRAGLYFMELSVGAEVRLLKFVKE